VSFSYSAGTSSATLAGLAEIGGIRINDGTFISEHLAGIIDSPPVRTSVSDFPSDHGGFVGATYYGPREIELAGRIRVTSADDVPSARDYLKAAFTLTSPDISWALVVAMRGWATKRQCTVKLRGPITFEEPETVQRKVPYRDFTIPLIAADPYLYDADNLRSIDIPMTGAATPITNAGTAPAYMVARFTGPWTTSATLTHTASGQHIIYTGGAIGGAYIDHSTAPTPTVISNALVNLYAQVTDWTLFTIPPGTSNFTATATAGTSGASKVTLIYRDAWT
jgi:hypothetical protein